MGIMRTDFYFKIHLIIRNPFYGDRPAGSQLGFRERNFRLGQSSLRGL
jgi:hypothetical protein